MCTLDQSLFMNSAMIIVGSFYSQMSIVYTAIATFENSVRDLVAGVLAEEKGESWWSQVAKGIRENAEKRMEDEKKTKWHTQRGQDPINYTTLGNLHAMRS